MSVETRPARSIIKNGWILSVNDEFEILPSGNVLIEDGIITAITTAPIDTQPGDRVIDAAGSIVMPGLINAHTHSFQTLMRGQFEFLTLLPWLRLIYGCGLALDVEAVERGFQLCAVESLKGGVTTVVDHHFLNRKNEFTEAVVRSAADMGIRLGVARTIIDVQDLAPAEITEDPDKAIDQLDQLRTLVAQLDSSSMCIVLGGANTPGVSSSERAVRASVEYAHATGVINSMHVAESRGVRERVKDTYGVDGVVKWLESLGAVSPQLLAAHSVCLDTEEVAIMGAARASVSHNPVSNLFLGDGIAPWAGLSAAGATVALGTDGACSNNKQDMFEVLKCAALLTRLPDSSGQAVSLRQAIEAATINGARALGLADRVGSIEVGKEADLIIISVETTTGVSAADPASHVVHSASRNDVTHVMVAGRLLVEDGNMADFDEAELLQRAKASATRLVKDVSHLAV